MNIKDIQARCDRVPFFRFLDFTITKVDDTQLMAQMPFAERHIGNPVLETFHGGIIASFMEAIASICVLDDITDDPAKPINLTVDYLRPGLAGTLTTRATITKKGRRWPVLKRWLGWRTKPNRWQKPCSTFCWFSAHRPSARPEAVFATFQSVLAMNNSRLCRPCLGQTIQQSSSARPASLGATGQF